MLMFRQGCHYLSLATTELESIKTCSPDMTDIHMRACAVLSRQSLEFLLKHICDIYNIDYVYGHDLNSLALDIQEKTEIPPLKMACDNIMSKWGIWVLWNTQARYKMSFKTNSEQLSFIIYICKDLINIIKRYLMNN